MQRPRRLRVNPVMRAMVRENHVRAEQLVLPAFVAEGITEPRPIAAMPGVYQHTLDSIRREAVACAEAGIAGIMLFGVPTHRDAVGSEALNEHGILAEGIRAVRQEVGDDLLVMSDVCLDEFTDHGHCGVLTPDGTVDNDPTVRLYARMATLHAECGSHVVGPSGMMDGQVRAIREALDAAGHTDTVILAYSAKYASAFFGPFREAVASTLTGDRKAYQQDPANAREAIHETLLDIDEGADIVMVKPGLPYLDILRTVHDLVDVPVAAYCVSGEYSMIEAAAANGWLDHDRTVDEALTSLHRAGADIILTYWALDWARRHGRGERA